MADTGGAMTVRYAEYLESIHNHFLTSNGQDAPGTSFCDAYNTAVTSNPYQSWSPISASLGVCGSGYTIGNFPSLLDMFGKFMAGLDVEYLWENAFEDTVASNVVNDVILNHGEVLRDNLEQTVLPQFLGGMRDINAIQSSTFIVGKALLYDGVTRELNRFGTELKTKMLAMAQDKWAKHLDWNKTVIATYSDIMKLFYSIHMDMEQVNYDMKTKSALWHIKLFEPARAIIGALNGAAAAQSGAEPSSFQKAASGALSGAAAGAQLGGGWGALAGGLLGGAAGWSDMFK